MYLSYRRINIMSGKPLMFGLESPNIFMDKAVKLPNNIRLLTSSQFTKAHLALMRTMRLRG